TGALVTTASIMTLPVSTTHVSVGSLFGIGAAGGGAHKKMILQVVLSWVLTLPIAAIVAALVSVIV
ncbi:MAG: inorganic phosphate transporter, partial [Planctomycetes bacterium]|nr:inorganic phosphate transporter [Planctomycetota bacterium]